MRKVLIATPAYGGQVTEAYFQSMLALTAQAYSRGLHLDVMTLTNESLITRARNDIVARFMQGDWTDLIWIDADIKFEPEHVFRLLESRHDVCAVPYPMKRLDWDAMSVMHDVKDMQDASIISVINFVPDAQVVNGYAQALDVGTGFMRVTRSALESMIEAYPELEYQTDMHGSDGIRWALYDTMLENGRYLSEDYAFCRRWQAIGGEVWVDLEAPMLGHQGSYTYGK